MEPTRPRPIESGRRDLLLDPGSRDLLDDGERRDLLQDPGEQDMVRDRGVRDSFRLDAWLTGRLTDEVAVTELAGRSGAYAIPRRRD